MYFWKLVTLSGTCHHELGKFIEVEGLTARSAVDVVYQYMVEGNNVHCIMEEDIARLLFAIKFCEFKADCRTMFELVKSGRISDDEIAPWILEQLKFVDSPWF